MTWAAALSTTIYSGPISPWVLADNKNQDIRCITFLSNLMSWRSTSAFSNTKTINYIKLTHTYGL